VAVISEDIVRELAGVRGNGAPVTTCYLDVDGRRHRAKSGYEQTLGRLMREVRPARDDVRLQRDLDRIERYVRSGIDRSRTRGLAIFACSATDLWRVVNLPVPVRDQLIVNDAPAVGNAPSFAVTANIAIIGVTVSKSSIDPSSFPSPMGRRRAPRVSVGG